jgi:hypothetical protein
MAAALGPQSQPAFESRDVALHIAAILTGERMLTKYTGGSEPPSHDEIARLAYQFYETHGRREGQDLDHWLAAEQELTRHYR